MLFSILMCTKNSEKTVEKESFEKMKLALRHEENPGVWGYEMALKMQNFVTDEVESMWFGIIGANVDYSVRRIYELL